MRKELPVCLSSFLTSTGAKAQKLARQLGIETKGFLRPSAYNITIENAGAILGKVYFEDMPLHPSEVEAVMYLLQNSLLPERAIGILSLIAEKHDGDVLGKTMLDIETISEIINGNR